MKMQEHSSFSLLLLALQNFSEAYFIRGLQFLLFILLITSDVIYSQTTVFSDNFEGGTTNWTLQGTWNLTTTESYSANHSLTTANSSGTYLANQNISATLVSGIDLSSYAGAEIDFYAQYDLEQSFDFVYLEVSNDGGTNWNQVASFNGTLSTWTQYKIDIGAFAGNSNLLIRFRLKSDQNVEFAGIYIDDFQVIGLPTDTSAPLVIAQSPQFYQGTQNAYTANAKIYDASGIQSALLYYKVDGTGQSPISPSSVSGNNYTFTIPAQPSGAYIYYKIGATDNSSAHNVSDTAVASVNTYISGTYLSYDNGAADAVSTFASSGGNSGSAVKISVGSNANLVSALIRNYSDSNHSNNQMLFHVWGDDGTGKPGSDLITPFLVTPAATLTNPYPMTVIDLRPYASQLSGLSGNIYIGFTVPSGSVNIISSNTVTGNRSYSYNGSAWSAVTTDDYEMRAIINDNTAFPVEITSFTARTMDAGIQLNWTTATEVNNYGFEIEKKLVSNWLKIGFVAGHGNSNSPKSYSYTDNDVSNGSELQYRLKQIDDNGSFEYSNPVSITLSTVKFGLSQNFPNPFNPTTSIRYYVSKNSFVTLTVYDILGKQIETLVNGIKGTGSYDVNFNGSNLPSGIYLYRIVLTPTDGSEGFSAVKKLMLLK
jgi:hypothetical protein